LNVNKLEHLNEVRVDFCRVLVTGAQKWTVNSSLPEDTGASAIEWKALKGRCLSTRAGYMLRVMLELSFTDACSLAEAEIAQPGTYVDIFRLDQKVSPFATFIFKCHTTGKF